MPSSQTSQPRPQAPRVGDSQSSSTKGMSCSRGLYIRRVPGLGADGAQERGGMKSTGPDFHVVGLQQHASLAVPECIELQDQMLEGQHEERRFYRRRAWRAIDASAAK